MHGFNSDEKIISHIVRVLNVDYHTYQQNAYREFRSAIWICIPSYNNEDNKIQQEFEPFSWIARDPSGATFRNRLGTFLNR